MLPKKNRIPRAEFVSYAKCGRLLRGALLSLRVSRSPTPKWSVVVSKKTAKCASDRHRIKRRIYAVLEDIVMTHPEFGGVCYPSFACLYAPFDEIKKEIEGLLLGVRR